MSFTKNFIKKKKRSFGQSEEKESILNQSAKCYVVVYLLQRAAMYFVFLS